MLHVPLLVGNAVGTQVSLEKKKKNDSPSRPVLIPFTIVFFFHILIFKHTHTYTITHKLLTYNIVY